MKLTAYDEDHGVNYETYEKYLVKEADLEVVPTMKDVIGNPVANVSSTFP